MSMRRVEVVETCYKDGGRGVSNCIRTTDKDGGGRLTAGEFGALDSLPLLPDVLLRFFFLRRRLLLACFQ